MSWQYDDSLLGPLCLGTTRAGKVVHVMRDHGRGLMTPMCGQNRSPQGNGYGRRADEDQPTCKRCASTFRMLRQRQERLSPTPHTTKDTPPMQATPTLTLGATYAQAALENTGKPRGPRLRAAMATIVETVPERRLERTVMEFCAAVAAELRAEMMVAPPTAEEIPVEGPGAAGELAPGSEQPSPAVAEALAAWYAGNEESTVTIRGAYRDLNSRGDGVQCYRRIVYPGTTLNVWVACARLPALGGVSVSSRKCATTAEVPVGSLILNYETPVERYGKSQATLTVGLVARQQDGAADIVWLQAKRLRSRAALVVTLPDGATLELEVER